MVATSSLQVWYAAQCLKPRYFDIGPSFAKCHHGITCRRDLAASFAFPSSSSTLIRSSLGSEHRSSLLKERERGKRWVYMGDAGSVVRHLRKSGWEGAERRGGRLGHRRLSRS